jgi:ribosomal protein L30E
MPTVFVERFKQLSIKQLNKYQEMGRENAISYIIKYCDTWDVYSLSMMMMRTLQLFKNSDTENLEFLKMFEMILSINMHPDPSRRLKTLETYNYILDYMKTITTKKKGEIKKIISSVTKNAVNIKKKLTAQIKYDHALSQKISIFKENH